jgi:soluble lytic murein transglycosylase-like protein
LVLALFFLVFSANPSFGTSPLTYECVYKSSVKFQVPLAMILVILDTERGSIGYERVNSNGSYDLGPMQINTLWLPALAKLGITKETLRDNGCVNVAVGAWILRYHLNRTQDPLKAISHYHSQNPTRQKIYLNLVLERLRKLEVSKTLQFANGKKS